MTARSLQAKKAACRNRARSRGVSYREVSQLARMLPGVEPARSYGMPSLTVRGKLLARLRSEADVGTLAVRCDFVEREILLQREPRTFFVTEHYIHYPMVLVRLERVRALTLIGVLEKAWRMIAPAHLTQRLNPPAAILLMRGSRAVKR